MLLDELNARFSAQLYASSSGSGSPAWYLWLGNMADSTAFPDRGVALLESGGPPEILNLRIDQPLFQVLVRGARTNQVSSAYEEAREKAEQIKFGLHMLTDATLSGVRYLQIQAEQEPFYIGNDANERPVFSCNYRAWREST
jgi:hypothetical protein